MATGYLLTDPRMFELPDALDKHVRRWEDVAELVCRTDQSGENIFIFAISDTDPASLLLENALILANRLVSGKVRKAHVSHYLAYGPSLESHSFRLQGMPTHDKVSGSAWITVCGKEFFEHFGEQATQNLLNETLDVGSVDGTYDPNWLVTLHHSELQTAQDGSFDRFVQIVMAGHDAVAAQPPILIGQKR